MTSLDRCIHNEVSTAGTRQRVCALALDGSGLIYSIEKARRSLSMKTRFLQCCLNDEEKTPEISRALCPARRFFI